VVWAWRHSKHVDFVLKIRVFSSSCEKSLNDSTQCDDIFSMRTTSINQLQRLSITSLVITIFVCLSPNRVGAQTFEEAQESNQLDSFSILDSRSASLGGASSVFVNDISSLYINPSGLSQSVFSKSTGSDGIVRELRFPKIGLARGEGSIPLKYDFQKSGLSEAPKDGGVIDGVLDGTNQYGRLAFSPLSMLVGNVGLMIVVDEQVSSYSSLEPQGGVDFEYRSFSGLIVGSSFDLEPFTVGVSRTIGTLESIRTNLSSAIAEDVEARRNYLKDRVDKSKLDKYQIAFARNFVPSLNLRGTAMLRDHDFNNKEKEGVWSAGLGIAPYLGKRARLAITTEMQSINRPMVSMNKKPRAGVELDVLNEQGNLTIVSLRSGYSSAGLSYGACLNIGLIKVEVASEIKDVGIKTETTLQRRTSAILSIDVASPQ
jgi:hypothetical protein